MNHLQGRNLKRKAIHLTETHIVPNIPTPVRLQEYGVGLFTAALTKSALKKVLKKKSITVNNVVATTATYIRGGEQICLSLVKEIHPNKKLSLPLTVLFEDDHLAVIRKPAGVLVSGNRFKTVANALVQNLQRSALPDATKPQPVHRLDYPTTGVLLIGKTSSSIRALNKMFEEKKVEKIYYAVTIGMMKGQGEIISEVDEKKSESMYSVVQSVFSKRFGTLNLVQLTPQTGRRHQLRKHLSSIHSPILGDQEYGIESLILTGKGLYLHAFSLHFKHPCTNQDFYIEDALPQRFRKIFNMELFRRDS